MTLQWAQLIALAVMHLLIDMFAGIMPAILPAVRTHFALSLTMGIALLTVLNFASNFMQITIGNFREDKERPLFMQAAFLLAVCMCLLGFIPLGSISLPLLFAVMAVGGTGVAVFHPESMRAIHRMEQIPASISTSVLMMGGYLGFCGGAYIGAALVEVKGLKGLVYMLYFAAGGLVLVFLMRFRLAVEKPHDIAEGSGTGHLSFWPLFVMALPVALGTIIIISLLPTYLHELEFELSFGGMSSFFFGTGLGIGGVLWGILAQRRGEVLCSVVSLFLGVPFLLLYLYSVHNKISVILLIVCGFCAGGGYPMLASKARNASGLNLGKRMGLMVGGVWGLGSLGLMLLTPVAEHIGVGSVLNLGWICYLGAACYGVVLVKKGY